jgi:hypothetical protein
MFKTLNTHTGVSVEALGAKLISIRLDGNNVFQDSRIRVIIHMKETMVPIFIRMHHFVH